MADDEKSEEDIFCSHFDNLAYHNISSMTLVHTIFLSLSLSANGERERERE